MSTSTIDFSKYESAAPAQIDFSKYETPTQPSVGQRVRQNFAEGLGITNDEGAKNFFEHPISTLMNSLDAQGQLAIKAKEAYAKGDYSGALMYGLNYLVPFLGQQTAKAGEQLNEGDIAGGAARTLGAAVPALLGSPEGRATIGDAASSAVSAAKPAIAKAAGVASDIVDPEITGIISPRLAHVQRALGKLSDALDKSQQVHSDVVAADLDATGENKPYAGESARGRKFTAAKVDVQPIATAIPEQPQPAPVRPIYNPADRPLVVPSVQNIRENIAQANAAEAMPNRFTPDAIDDHALQQEMNQDLEKHGWAADSAARREFIARNSTGVTKSELTGAAEKPVKYTKTPGVTPLGTGADDLTDLLQRSLAAARKAKAQQ
jgi:hypothetical protein